MLTAARRDDDGGGDGGGTTPGDTAGCVDDLSTDVLQRTARATDVVACVAPSRTAAPLRLCLCVSITATAVAHTATAITITGVAVLPYPPSPTPAALAAAPSPRARIGHTRSPTASPARSTLPCSGRVCGRLVYLPVCALLEWAFDAAGAPGPAVGALFQAEDVVAYTLAARLVAPALNTFSLHDVTAAVAEAIETAVGKGSRTGEQPPSSS